MHGEMSEWLKEHAWKTIPATLTERHLLSYASFPPSPSIGTSLPGIEGLEELLRFDRRVLGHVRKQQLLVRTHPFLHVPLERKPHIVLSYQTRAYRRLPLTHPEQKAVISVSDESRSRNRIRSIRDGSVARTACDTFAGISTTDCGVVCTSRPPIVRTRRHGSTLGESSEEPPLHQLTRHEVSHGDPEQEQHEQRRERYESEQRPE